MKKGLLILTFFVLILPHSKAQKTSILLGNNATHFSDWERIFNFFNPEIIVSKKLQRNCILVSVDGFYGKSPSDQVLETGVVYDRMVFTLKGNYALRSKNLLLGLGPSVRYRNEKTFSNRPPGYDWVGKLNEEYFDLGLNGSALYMFNTGKNLISLKLGYSAFNKGRNPISLGIFYGWQWKK